MNQVTTLGSADIALQIMSRNTNIDSFLVNDFLVYDSFAFFWDFKDRFNKHGYNFDDVSKNGHSRFLIIKTF